MNTIKIILGIIVIFSTNKTLIAQDYLKSLTVTGSGITTNNSKAWTDITSITIDLGSNISDTKYVLITASINMRPAPFPLTNTGAREGNYNIYRSDLTSDASGVIKRQIKALSGESDVQSWGVGTLVHIFDVSGLSGNKTYTIEHSNNGGSDDGRNVESNVRLTAIALSTATNHYELSNSVKRLGDPGSTSTSTTYAAVSGLTSDTINLPIKGDIYVAASVNGTANGIAVAEYRLEYSSDNGSNWLVLGKSIKRSVINQWDDGIVSLVGLLKDADASDGSIIYKFRVAHKRVSGPATVTTHNSNLIAVALAHSGGISGGYFPSFSSEIGTPGMSITGVSTLPATVLSVDFLSNFDISSLGPNLFIGAQYLVNASNLNESTPQRMRAGNNLYIDDGTLVNLEEYYRYIPVNTNYGSGGFFGLLTDLNENTTITVGMKHQLAYVSNPDITEDEVLNTSQVILTGFQTYDVTGGTTLPIDLSSFTAIYDGSIVNLEWSTASEENNDYFTIERSSDSRNWQIISKVEGAGSSSQTLKYTTVDNFPLKTKAYYRLKQTDFDGKYTYSQTVVVNSNNSEILLFPNPTNNKITILGADINTDEIMILNNLGQDLGSEVEVISNSNTELVLSLGNLSSGVYFIKTNDKVFKVYKK